MEREEALVKLQALVGSDLLKLAAEHKIDVHVDVTFRGQSVRRVSKGWAGHTVESLLGLPRNSAREPNFGSWELKVVPVRKRRDGTLCAKETMAIAMINSAEVEASSFEQSHLYAKLRRMIVVARTFVDKKESAALVYSVGSFDLTDPQIYRQVKADYDSVRQTIKTRGFQALSGKMGILVQPRTKGTGYGSKTRAFYARTGFVEHMLGIKSCK